MMVYYKYVVCFGVIINKSNCENVVYICVSECTAMNFSDRY